MSALYICQLFVYLLLEATLTASHSIPRVRSEVKLHALPKMPASKWIRVRPLTISDFRFIRGLASKQVNFTVPPPYVLWLLKQTNPGSCFVAEHVKMGPVAYLLSVLVGTRRGNVLYIWQLAASRKGMRTGAIDVTLLALRRLVSRARVRKVFFTARPDASEFRAIRRYVNSLFGTDPRARRVLPAAVSRREFEYVFMPPRQHS
jgi:hypothetical protein